MSEKINLVFCDHSEPYFLKNSEFIPEKVTSKSYQIEKVLVDGLVYKLMNSDCYIICSRDRTLWWFINNQTQYFSGTKKATSDIYESGGALVDRNIKALNFRTSKTGSTSVYNSFRLDVCGDEYMGSGWPWIKEIWLTKQELQKINLDDYFKFIIYRDPIDRLYSQLAFVYSFYKFPYPVAIRNNFFINFDTFKKYAFTVLEVNQFFECRDEFHISHQKFLINFSYPNAPLDCICMIQDIERFFTDKLKIKFSYRLVGGKNRKERLDMYSNFILTDYESNVLCPSVLKADFQLLEENKDKIYE